MAGKARTVERMLDDIEHHVLEEVWLGRRRSVIGWALVGSLFATVMLWRIDVAGYVPTAAVVMLSTASILSGLALAVRRYRWCCVAAYSCGLASVVGIGAFWWVRTGRPDTPLTWLIIADIAVVTLTVHWLAVIVTPIERSQPDIRFANP
ncbi:hypothetical protein [Mycobacterium sp. AT1]|uniref:hypothetical protein n=1 Tax=Mycobacterium sp. AT1 TaxID=1961706 RepID=UPI0011540478|nr:hypothetical protein [Mycobacterium sp. AT1]